MRATCLLPLLLLFSASLADKGSDQYRAYLSSSRGNKKTSGESLRTDESKYSASAEASRSKYQRRGEQQLQQHHHRHPANPTAAREHGNQLADYAELQSYETFKYAPEQQQQQQQQQYTEDPKATYQSSLITNPSEEQYYIPDAASHNYDIPPQKPYYIRHQQQQQQQQTYQPEVAVGNQLQSSRQKVSAQKYHSGNDDKGAYYANIPMSQLLAYYQNQGVIESRNKNAEQISVPVYSQPLLARNQNYAPAKVTYQPEVEFTPDYPKQTQMLNAKSSKSSAAYELIPTAASPSPSHQSPQYVGSSSYPQNYQYFVIQPIQQQQQQQQHQQYQQQQPATPSQPQQDEQYDYDTASPSYADIYNSLPTSYDYDNTIYQQQQQQQQQQEDQQKQQQHQQENHQQQQYHSPTVIAQQLMEQMLHHANQQNTLSAADQNSIKQELQEALNSEFLPPQYHAQSFRASHEVSHSLPPSIGAFPTTRSPVAATTPSSSPLTHSSQPKSLLDSYVPSHVLHAQDANRYRERPIKLESGFLPSNINFVPSYKKRKHE